MQSDPVLAQDHEAGASIACIQVLEHEQLGAVSYEWPRFWPSFLNEARAARDELAAVHAVMERAEPGPSDSRSLRYPEIEGAIASHARMAIATVLTLRYFVLEVERVAGLRPATGTTDDLDRLRSACTNAGLPDPALSDKWSTIGELVGMRHRVEHPTQDTIYSSESWDQVPLAWALTKRALDSYDAFDQAFCDVADSWEAHKAVFAKPGTFDILARGLRGKRRAKKPPVD